MQEELKIILTAKENEEIENSFIIKAKKDVALSKKALLKKLKREITNSIVYNEINKYTKTHNKNIIDYVILEDSFNTKGERIILITFDTIAKIEAFKYKGREIKKIEKGVIDEKVIEFTTEMIIYENATLAETKGTVQEDCVVEMSLELKIDKEVQENISFKEKKVVLKRNELPSGVVEKILGMEKGETKEFTEPVGDEIGYVTVTVKNIYRITETQEETLKKIGFKNYKDLENKVRMMAQKKNDEKYLNSRIIMVFETILKDIKVEVPERLFEVAKKGFLNVMTEDAKEQGYDLLELLKKENLTTDDYIEGSLEKIKTKVKISLLIEHIANMEQINVTNDELDEMIIKVLNLPDASKIPKDIERDFFIQIERMARVNKTVDFLIKNTKEI